MATYKCKMCGGSFEIAEGMSVCECEYCGTSQTLPRSDSEQMLNMFNRANHFRQQCEFDKAAEIYERMTADSTNPELYWSIVLCRYGIEYVDDPLTKKKIPTCHRTQYGSILDDADYQQALSLADTLQRSVYEQEAKYIDTVQKGILEISNKEEPFDVFICYKESDENGRRTPDSVLAQELYYGLVSEGFKVFFSRITLESKLGTEYEPYIFAALNSAKVMVVVGTKPEYFNAVWVRNEWSRYLMLMHNDKSRTLIPAYKDMDPYDLPDALSMFQAQDMSKLGFMQDLIRGISKIVKAETPQPAVVKETVVQTASANSNAAPLLKRAAIFLGDRDWDSANEYCEKVLDIDPENAQAYLYKVLAKMGITSEDDMSSAYITDFLDSSKYVDNDPDYKKAYKYGDSAMQSRLDDFRQSMIYNGAMRALQAAKNDDEYRHAAKGFDIVANYKDGSKKSEECEENAKAYLYTRADLIFNRARSDRDFDDAIAVFSKVSEYKDSAARIAQCEEKAKEYLYTQAIAAMNRANNAYDYSQAAKMFVVPRINRYKDTQEKAQQCRDLTEKQKTYDNATDTAKRKLEESQNKAAELFDSISDFKDSAEKAEECRKKAAEYLARDKAAKRKSSIAKFIGIFGAVCAIILVVLFTVILPSVRYNNALKMVENGQYDEAIAAFEALGDYKDSADQIKQANINKIKSGAFSKGDIIQFGDYSWVVLEKTENSALILEKDILFSKAYNDEYTDVTWEECTLRKYLNEDFYNKFSDEEKAMIQEVTNKNSDNAEYGTKGGNDTKDKIYLLSIDEAETLSSDVRKVSAWWWLRSPGLGSNRAAGVNSDGDIETYGNNVHGENGVRPIMNIKFDE